SEAPTSAVSGCPTSEPKAALATRMHVSRSRTAIGAGDSRKALAMRSGSTFLRTDDPVPAIGGAAFHAPPAGATTSEQWSRQSLRFSLTAKIKRANFLVALELARRARLRDLARPQHIRA